jgi:ketosteroid isomerase-like protein
MIMTACNAEPLAEPLQETAATTSVPSDAATRATVQTVYDGFATGDMDLATSKMGAAMIWNEAQGNPYADNNPYIGPDGVLVGLFARIGGEWDYFTAAPDEFLIDGPRVAVFGQYRAKHKETGRVMDATFAHVWTVDGDEITSFQQYTDTQAHVVAMGR